MGADYCCIISGISKSEAISLMQNTNLSQKIEHYKKWKTIISYKNG